MSKSLFLRRDGSITGPLSNQEVFERARSGELLPEDELSRSEAGPWRAADEVAALAAIFDGKAKSPRGSSQPEEEAAAAAVPLNERPFDIFVSHSNKDKKTADALVHVLEERGTRCWIAPRDITPGSSWAGSIMEAITQCRVFVLILSRNSNTSVQVLQEIERAVNRGLTVVPMRIEDIPPSQDLELFLGMRHWLDAFGGSQPQQLQECATAIQGILGVQADRPAPVGAKAVEPAQTSALGKRAGLAAGIAVMLVAGSVWALLGRGEGQNTGGNEGTSSTVEAVSKLEATKNPAIQAAESSQQPSPIGAKPEPPSATQIVAELSEWLPGARELEFQAKSSSDWGQVLAATVAYLPDSERVELTIESRRDPVCFARLEADLAESLAQSAAIALQPVGEADRWQLQRMSRTGSPTALRLSRGKRCIELTCGGFRAEGSVTSRSSRPGEFDVDSLVERGFEGTWITGDGAELLEAGFLARPIGEAVDLVLWRGVDSAVSFEPGFSRSSRRESGWLGPYQRSTSSPQNRIDVAPMGGRSGKIYTRVLSDGRLALAWSSGGVVLGEAEVACPQFADIRQAVESGARWVGSLTEGSRTKKVELRFVQPEEETASLQALLLSADQRSAARAFEGTLDSTGPHATSWPIQISAEYGEEGNAADAGEAFTVRRASIGLRRIGSDRLVGMVDTGERLELTRAGELAPMFVQGEPRLQALRELLRPGTRFAGACTSRGSSLGVSLEVRSFEENPTSQVLELAVIADNGAVAELKGSLEIQNLSSHCWVATLARTSERTVVDGESSLFEPRHAKELRLRYLGEGRLYGRCEYDRFELERVFAPAAPGNSAAGASPKTHAPEFDNPEFLADLSRAEEKFAEGNYDSARKWAQRAEGRLAPEESEYVALSLAIQARALYELGSRPEGIRLHDQIRGQLDHFEELLNVSDDAAEFFTSDNERIQPGIAAVLCEEARSAAALLGLRTSVDKLNDKPLSNIFYNRFTVADLESRQSRALQLLNSRFASFRDPSTGKTWATLARE